MIYFLAYLIPVLLGIFIVIPALRMRTSLLNDLDKEEAYVLGLLFCLVWPLSLVALLLFFILRPCVRLCAKLISKIEDSLEKKEALPPSPPPPPSVNEAKSSYRHVEFNPPRDQ
jgi:hypothetical protein